MVSMWRTALNWRAHSSITPAVAAGSRSIASMSSPKRLFNAACAARSLGTSIASYLSCAWRGVDALPTTTALEPGSGNSGRVMAYPYAVDGCHRRAKNALGPCFCSQSKRRFADAKHRGT